MRPAVTVSIAAIAAAFGVAIGVAACDDGSDDRLPFGYGDDYGDTPEASATPIDSGRSSAKPMVGQGDGGGDADRDANTTDADVGDANDNDAQDN
jgi:hypothetical protein